MPSGDDLSHDVDHELNSQAYAKHDGYAKRRRTRF